MTEVVRSLRDGGIATLVLDRPPVNALAPATVAALTEQLQRIQDDPGVSGVVLTGNRAFFSFGFDVPAMVDWPPERFRVFVTRFCGLYRAILASPKAVVAALNGHAVAGGCMLALACDERLATDVGRIGLNEITFGASVFAGVVAMLEQAVGSHSARRVLQEGELLPMVNARSMGLVDDLVDKRDLEDAARARAEELSAHPTAFAHLKVMRNRRLLWCIETHERASIDRFVEIWYEPDTREMVRDIEIRL